MKVSVIGAGNVGATCADIIAQRQLANEIVLLDILEGIAEGKAMDIMQKICVLGIDSVVKGVTKQYSKTVNSDVVVVTSGIPRKPGMTREELIGINAGIVKSVMENAMTVSPNAIFVVITNPLDTMTLVALITSGLPKNKVIGMGGALDSARFKYFLSQQTQKPVSDIDSMVIGGHGDTTMLPLMRLASYKGIPITELLNETEQAEVITQTMNGGATLTKLLGTSAWYGPGAAIASVVESILYDRKKLIPCSAFLQEEYGEENICIGVPCIIGKTGIEKVVELKLSKSEKEKFDLSAKSIREINTELRNILT